MPGSERVIYLQPIALSDPVVLSDIAVAVEQEFGFDVRVLEPIPVPDYAFNEGRGQYHSTTILKRLNESVPADAVRVLGITDVDLFVPQLNFVFGEAAIDGLVCIISLHRLHPEYYGERADQKLFRDRAVKEAVHELGHTFGLRHSDDPKCVMFFSNTIWDTDRKSARFCGRERQQIASRTNALRKAA